MVHYFYIKFQVMYFFDNNYIDGIKKKNVEDIKVFNITEISQIAKIKLY